MSLFGSLTDALTGGKNQEAETALQEGIGAVKNVRTPTTQDLTIPQLQQYVIAGIMTPAQAVAYLQNSNAYSSIQLDPTSLQAEYQALSQLQNIAQSGGNDAESKQAMQEALDQSTQALRGEEGSNVLQAEQRGVAPGLAVEAANEADIGNNANALFSADQAAAAAAENRQLAALSGVGAQAGAIQGQTTGLAENTAAAQNAINAFNAQNQTQVSQYNANNQQAANVYNAQNAQHVADSNTQQNNSRAIYNSTVAPQTAYQDALSKAEGVASADSGLAKTYQGEGQQTMGVAGTAAELAALALLSHGGEVDMKGGGVVPGQARVPGDSPLNDIVPAHVGQKQIRLSPGEIVLPRTVAQHATPDKVQNFLRSLPRHNVALPKEKQIHPKDIASVLEALGHMRGQPNV